ncbi:MAG: hypothetical protein R2876_04050 [Eubacteriales bacterium]
MKKYKKSKNKKDSESQLAIDDDETQHFDDEIGMPEDVRVIHSGEANPHDG